MMFIAQVLKTLYASANIFSSSADSFSIKQKTVGEYISESGFYQSIDLVNEPPIVDQQSQYQNITVVRSKHYGKILTLDGVVQLTEKDANSYNEMMAHPAMFLHPNPKRVLVIGGGDGYVLSEILKHPSVEHVDHVDLDKEVIDVCKEHFSWGKAWDDPRVSLHISDGATFLDSTDEGFYDVIIQDSSDPETADEHGQIVDLPSKVLYERDHFVNIYRALAPNGVFNFQAETFGIESDLEGIVSWRKSVLDVGFKEARYGSLTISSYPTGQIGFLLCQKEVDSKMSSMEQIERRFEDMENADLGTDYYQPKLQSSAFDLPLWVERRIYSKESKAMTREE